MNEALRGYLGYRDKLAKSVETYEQALEAMKDGRQRKLPPASRTQLMKKMAAS
ncbi:hypothetical protein HJB86_14615 [Rhizobium sp. NZLR3b]|uniref:hypothetical protein n=1 Tax=Rhizobium sp. NZLR3b TaxID=2731101 RepID=UPI001C82ED32|nr:hypothetical protein [Rhizobium sp. NZLR3b]MBX5190140.1 hypothetical protein [Rhizobium sp. NZLR3b]